MKCYYAVTIYQNTIDDIIEFNMLYFYVKFFENELSYYCQYILDQSAFVSPKLSNSWKKSRSNWFVSLSNFDTAIINSIRVFVPERIRPFLRQRDSQTSG